MTLGAGSLPEETFGICLREDCPTVKMLRNRALKHVLSSSALATPSGLLTAAERAVRRVGYAADVRGAVVEEYARVLSLDVSLSEHAAVLLGGWPGQALEELLYQSRDPVVDALHTAMMALYMEYIDGSDVQRLGVLDFAAYAVLELLRRGWMPRSRAAELLSWFADQALVATA
jgi:hypothetical protein